MPIYRFLCTKCNNEFKGTFKVNETKVECPECKSNETERLVSRNVGVSYNGKGYTKALKAAKRAAGDIVNKTKKGEE